jgi:hypothetical protein
MHQIFICISISEKHILCIAVHREVPKEHATPQHFEVGQFFSKLFTYTFENNYLLHNKCWAWKLAMSTNKPNKTENK